jgi:hypothetical protein
MSFVYAGRVVPGSRNGAWPKLTENCLGVRRTELAQIQSGLAVVATRKCRINCNETLSPLTGTSGHPSASQYLEVDSLHLRGQHCANRALDPMCSVKPATGVALRWGSPNADRETHSLDQSSIRQIIHDSVFLCFAASAQIKKKRRTDS